MRIALAQMKNEGNTWKYMSLVKTFMKKGEEHSNVFFALS